jgi:hypothetical protein
MFSTEEICAANAGVEQATTSEGSQIAAVNCQNVGDVMWGVARGVYRSNVSISNIDDVAISNEARSARQTTIAWCHILGIAQPSRSQPATDVVVVNVSVEHMTDRPAAFAYKTE